MASPEEKSSWPDGDKYPECDRPELRPEGFKGVRGGTVPAPRKPQPQPTSGEV
jgi:hypothetical protein